MLRHWVDQFEDAVERGLWTSRIISILVRSAWLVLVLMVVGAFMALTMAEHCWKWLRGTTSP